ncbi:hypothetical protein [Falsibacillus albus]|uniref:Uncharacterized protein n=1 Tax=Falsibacillus albus TaxID=2478915 RepID=A0A3L7JWA0_9BACI|nr:hypothetical protein [Falsibacillus albus]RLQ95138.1 hypothetical protein D9X91_11605 [Falsibacillus albus]
MVANEVVLEKLKAIEQQLEELERQIQIKVEADVNNERQIMNDKIDAQEYRLEKVTEYSFGKPLVTKMPEGPLKLEFN